MVGIRRGGKPKVPIIETPYFTISWTDELETALINIIRYYINGGKLADNIFKKQDHAAIVIELQPIYVSLGIGPATNVISGIQIKGHINWVSVPFPDSP
jgi:hypothetical protein